jgi:NAD(P)-dependent dehydrogenase (short-subunit alcohol dehydrogenase family)
MVANAGVHHLTSITESECNILLVLTSHGSKTSCVILHMYELVEPFGPLMIFSVIILVEERDWDRVMSVNVKGTMFSYKHAARQMIKQGRGGRIIGAASLAPKRGEPNNSRS